MTTADVPASYREAHRYDGAAVEHGSREAIERCALQPRDVAIVRDIQRYKFLTAPQLRELWWAAATVQAADRRLLKLFRAGLLERFRPYARRGLGSFPWTYHLGEQGHQLLLGSGILPRGHRHRARTVFDYGHVLHEIQLNAWVLAYRRAIADGFLSWDGESVFEPPSRLSVAQGLEDDWSIEGLRARRPLPVYPDAVVEIRGEHPADESRILLIEYDRTRRLDKNYDKLERYDAFLNWWWRFTSLGTRASPPFVLFVCQDEEQRERFLAAADHRLTGHRWHPDLAPDSSEFVGRGRTLFASEVDAHIRLVEARRLPAVPRGHPDRDERVRRVRLGPLAESDDNDAAPSSAIAHVRSNT
jgi:hypothetical protein